MPGKSGTDAGTRQPPASWFSGNRPVNAQRGCTVNKLLGTSAYSAMAIGRCNGQSTAKAYGVTIPLHWAPYRKSDFTPCPAKEEHHKAAHEVHHHMAPHTGSAGNQLRLSPNS
jgi:hypothetical protein